MAQILMKVTIAQVQKVEDIGHFEDVIRKHPSDLIVFPEETFFTENYDFEAYFKSLCKKYNTRIVIGIILTQKKSYNYAYYFSKNRVERYQKVHVHWTEKYVPGKEFKVINTKLGKIGLLICYDLAFQETGRILALKGAKIIVLISAIPSTFPAKISLIRQQAMSVNNQLFTIECRKPGERFIGNSAIFNPLGNNLLKLGKRASIRSKTMDISSISRWRKKEKIFQFRKPNLYREIMKPQKRQS